MDFQGITVDALIDSGALVNCMSNKQFEQIKNASPDDIVKEAEPPGFKLQVANGDLEAPLKTAILKFEIGDWNFKETFIIAERMSGPILGITFLKNNSAVLDVSQGLLHFPHLTMAMTTDEKTYNMKPLKIATKTTITIPADTTKTIIANINTPTKTETIGIVTPTDAFQGSQKITIASSISRAHDNQIELRVNNTSPTPYTIKKNTTLGEMKILTPYEAKNLKPVNPIAIKILAEDDSEQAHAYVNELMKEPTRNHETSQYWFPTPEDPGNESTHTPIQARILRELRDLKQIENLNPLNSPEQRHQFLANFKWDNSQLTPDEKAAVEQVLVDFNDIFARHRLDIGINTEFKIKLTPKNDQPVYSQSLPCPINLKEDLTVELALMHYYGIITTLPFSKYASPIFAQRKPNGKLRLLVDLRKINNLISDDYSNNNHPVSTLSDAAQHLAGKKLFCKLDCSQAYHVLQMADQKSVELLAFNFASRTFAYLRLAQGLSRSLSSFSSFMREFLDSAIKADKCAQYVDDIGIAANSATQLIQNIRDVFKCLRNAGLRLSMDKCQFGAQQVEFLGRTISPAGIAPQDHKITNYLEKLNFPKSKKALQRYLGFVNYYRNYIPRLSEKVAPFHDLLKTDKPMKVDKTTNDKFQQINQALTNACGLALKQPLPNHQYVLMTDASFQAAGYALMMEENPEQKITSTKKTYAPVAFGSRTFTPSQLKMSVYAKEFLAIYFAILEYSHILWGSTKPVVILTDNKAVTRFFQTKIIPPALWNACDYVLQYNFRIAHVPGKMNTAADFLSRADTNPKEKIILRIREDIQTTPIEVNIENSNVAQEEQFYFFDENTIETEDQIWEEKEKNRTSHRAPHTTTEETPQEITLIEVKQIATKTKETEYIRNNAQIRIEQDTDPVLRNLKLMILKEPYDEQRLKLCPRGQKYLQNLERIHIKDGLLMRKYYGETGEIKYNQILLPEHLVQEILEHHHGKYGRHPGITKVIQQCREKYYFPCLSHTIREKIRHCKDCIQTKRIDPTKITPPMIDMNNLAMGPEDALQIDVVPFNEASGGYNAVITAMDAFSRYLFAYNVVHPNSKSVAKVIIDIMTRHAYLPTCLISDKGSQFISEVTTEVAKVLGITMTHATTKHAQTIGRLERGHASLKTTLKIMTGERRTMWHKYVQIAVLNYNTTYHTSLGCEPSRVFHGRIPFNVMDIKLGIRPTRQHKPKTEIAKDIQKTTNELIDKTQKYLMQSFIKYKQYYDKRASAAPLNISDYCYVLHPQATTQSTKLPFSEYLWTGPYIVVKVLPNNNYVIRRLMTNKTQTLHRIRLRWYPTSEKLPDIVVQPEQYQPDKEVAITHDDLYAEAWGSDFGNPQFYRQESLRLQKPLQHEATIEVPEDGNTNTQDLPHTLSENGDTNDRLGETPQQSNAEEANYRAEETPQNTYFNSTDTNQQNQPEINTEHPKDVDFRIPRTLKLNLRQNPIPNVNKDFVYFNTIEAMMSQNNNHSVGYNPTLLYAEDNSPHSEEAPHVTHQICQTDNTAALYDPIINHCMSCSKIKATPDIYPNTCDSNVQTVDTYSSSNNTQSNTFVECGDDMCELQHVNNISLIDFQVDEIITANTAMAELNNDSRNNKARRHLYNQLNELTDNL